MKFYTHEESKDISLGKIGTPVRDIYEAELKSEIEAYRLGELVKKTRKNQKLTQKQLGEKVGVGESQICKIENGKAATFTTISRVFKALGATSGNLDLGSLGQVALW